MNTNHSLGSEIHSIVADNLRLIPDFPTEGVVFQDVTPLFANGPDFSRLVSLLADRYRGKIDMVAGLESRGFILAAPLAAELRVGMLAIRKAGKLPGPVEGIDYTLEYGTGRLEIQPSTVDKNARVLVIDDVLATGGTAWAAVELLRRCGAEPYEIAVLLELMALGGRERIDGVPVLSAVEVRDY